MEAVAKLRNYPTSPRKMRLLADLIRGMEVEKALDTLKFHTKHASRPLEKLLLSAIDNWEEKNSGQKVEDAGLFVKTIYVDGGRILKRIRPRAQGRANRINKRSNHVTIIVDAKNGLAEENELEKIEEQEAVQEVKETKEVKEVKETKKEKDVKAEAKKEAPEAKKEAAEETDKETKKEDK